MITSKDRKVIDFIEKFKIATTDTMAELFYHNKEDAEINPGLTNIKTAQRRLRIICEANLLKREREHFTAQYYYYIKKPVQLRHSLILTNFYRELHKIAEIKYFECEYICDNVRADGLVAYILKGINYVAFVEVQIANTPLDIGKYEVLYKSGNYKNYYPLNKLRTFPQLVAITNKSIPESNIKIIKVNEDIDNIREVLK